MDYKKDVFGDLAWDQNQLVDLIGEYAEGTELVKNRNFQEEEMSFFPTGTMTTANESMNI